MSEEAQESRSKDFRLYRKSYSRRISRIATNEDLLPNLLISSDPYTYNKFKTIAEEKTRQTFIQSSISSDMSRNEKNITGKKM